MQYVQFTICFASFGPLLVPHSIGRICFLFISSQKILRNENCKLHAYCCCCYGKLAQVLLSALVKFCGSNGAYDWRVWRLAGKLICILFKWIVWFLLLYNFIEYFWHVVILFLTQFVPLWRYIYAYKRCLLYIAVFILTSVIDTRLKCTALSTVLQFSPLGVACVNAKCRHGPQKVAPKPSRLELSLAYASRTTRWYMGRNNRPEIRTLSHLVMCMQQAQ